jgi:epoxyqueuosine reductase
MPQTLTSMTAHSFSAELKQEAKRLGFDLCGICPAVSPPGVHRFREWLAAGYAGQMHYLADRAEAYAHPGHVLDGARSIVMLAMNYRTAEPRAPSAGEGRVSRYAWGTDYHTIIRDRLESLANWLRTQGPQSKVRGVVDTAPLAEREFAQLAGLGWIGKNTLLLNKALGSWFFLAALLTDLELEFDAPHETDHCGTCRACLDACPTGAFVDAYVLDARRCISYLTIELRDDIPTDLRNGVGDWLFGCDVCQDVCPWNHRGAHSDEPGFQPLASANPKELTALFDLDDAAFRARFRHSPLWRAKRRGLLRNAAIVLGNRPHTDSLPALVRGLNDYEPLVRAACAWALGRYAMQDSRDALQRRFQIEADASVQSEIEASCAPHLLQSDAQSETSSASLTGCLPGKSSL